MSLQTPISISPPSLPVSLSLRRCMTVHCRHCMATTVRYAPGNHGRSDTLCVCVQVTCVDISTELDMTVSGAKVRGKGEKQEKGRERTPFLLQDGTCIIHTVRRGHYMHTLLPRRERHKCVVRHALISPLGRLLVYTEDKLARSKVSHTPSTTLSVGNVPGRKLCALQEVWPAPSNVPVNLISLWGGVSPCSECLLCYIKGCWVQRDWLWNARQECGPLHQKTGALLTFSSRNWLTERDNCK